MSTRRPTKRIACASAALAIAAGLAFTEGLAAEAVSEPAIKAAFLYNFAKFTEWPSDAVPQGTPIVLCVVGDTLTLHVLQQIVGGRLIDGHAVQAQSMDADGPLRSCHVLYVAGDDARRDAELLGRVKASPVLTVGDTERFARAGGVSRLFIADGKMRFAINVDATQRARLQISSKVLALGVIVRDEGNGNH